MNLALWQPLSNMTVESLADFSVRLPDDQARNSWIAVVQLELLGIACNEATN
jgi:hypothetical protein